MKRRTEVTSYLLAVDTSSELLGVGLLPLHPDTPSQVDAESREILSIEVDAGLRHVERVMPLVEELLAIAEVAVKELSGLVAPKGPGSFTGLRIGVSLLKGLSAATDTPITLVPTLEAFAAPFVSDPGLVCSVLDARKGRFYTQFFRAGEYLTPALDLTPQEIEARGAGLLKEGESLTLAGPDGDKLAALMEMEAILPPLRRRSAVRGLLARGRVQLADRHHLSDDGGPLYLRGSEAVFPSRKRGLGG